MENTHNLLNKVINALEHTKCDFWACDGPDKPFIHMKTCNTCYALQCLRRLKQTKPELFIEKSKKRKTIVGTSHFMSFEKVVQYYKEYGYNTDDVLSKLSNGEIHIGKPDCNEGETLGIDDGRYIKYIEDKD